MKARVIAFLNLRTGTPEILPDNNTGDKFFSPGDVVDIIEAVTGESIKENNVWYKLADGGFVWSGGVEKLTLSVTKSDFTLDPFHSLINYNETAFKNIPQNIKDSKGQGVKIAIIDTGINRNHPALKSDKIKVISDFTSSNIGTNDINGHGSHVAGLIGGRATSPKGVIGIAPLSELFIIKGVDDDGSTSAQNLNKALKAAIDLDVNIVNLSLDIAPVRYNIIEAEINRALAKGIIIIAAAGENRRLQADNPLLCPADKEGIIAVGSCDESGIQTPQVFQKKVSLIIPNYSFWSCFNEAKVFSSERGSSMATALVTGIASLIISSSKNSDRNSMIASLESLSHSLSQFKSGEISLFNPFKKLP